MNKSLKTERQIGARHASSGNLTWARDWGEMIREVLKNLADVLMPKQPAPVPVPVRDNSNPKRGK